jgi:hypothetical protein
MPILAGTPDSRPGPTFAFPSDGDPVLRLAEKPGEIRGAELHLLELWGDGRIRVQRPSYMRGSRDAQSRLAPAELDEILGMLASSGVLEFDGAAARARLRQARASRIERALTDPSVEIHDATDPDATSLEIRFDRIAPRGAGDGVTSETRRIDWLGLRADARFFPECPELAALAHAQAALWSLTTRAELK